MNRLVTEVVGSIVEAWAELRIHRTRVLLSLIGVAVAVAALTTVVGAGAIAEQAASETLDRQGGRPATIYLSAFVAEGVPDPSTATKAFTAAGERYSIEWTSRYAFTQAQVQFIDGVRPVETLLVDVDYGVMHRIVIDEGAWFTDRDVDRLAPAVIVNDAFWQQLGAPDLATHPTIELAGDRPTTAVLVGVAPSLYPEEPPSMTMLYDGYAAIASPQQVAQLAPSYELWVPPEIADELPELLRRDVSGALGENWQVDAGRQDYQAGAESDPLLPLKLVVGGVAVLILFLGALSLVNISLVTIRQRIREIGIRRSFGATAGRVFFSVMMESVVGTLAAGVVGVGIAVLVVQNPSVQALIAPGLTDVPAFPVDAALLGIAAAVAVGALAGLLPALVAVRVKVIDAIRY